MSRFGGNQSAFNETRGDTNQQGRLSPRTSAWGQEYLAGLPELFDIPHPIGRQSRGFRGTVGATITRSASVVALFAPGGYWGDAPQTLQATITAPEPWNRP
jgi:hypothetical protein